MSSNSVGSQSPLTTGSLQYELARAEAETKALHNLLRCYMREIAGPLGLVQVTRAPLTRLPFPAPSNTLPKAYTATVQLPHVQAVILASIDRNSPVGIGHFSDLRLTLQPTQQEQALTWQVWAKLLLDEMALHLGQPLNTDLLAQMQQSVDVTTFILHNRRGRVAARGSPAAAYMQSEQSLVYGHPFHPTPKARSGLDNAALRLYSPEVGAAFALHYFAVRRAFVVQDSLLPESTTDLVAQEGPAAALAQLADVSAPRTVDRPNGDDWVLLPMHPWQAEYLRTLPLVQAAEAQSQMRYLGAYGPAFQPTASVRTLYSRTSRFFYKVSLSFRITNCLRRNALPELAASLRVSRIMRALAPALAAHYPRFHPLEEQAYATVVLPTSDSAAQRTVSEACGFMLRQSIEQFRAPDEACLLAASLFGNEQIGRQELQTLRGLDGADHASPQARAAITPWFKSYVDQLAGPLLYLYFECGLMFEPHLQNVVVGFRSGQPVAVYLRDYENARLAASRVQPDIAAQLTDQERSELYYSEEKAWERFAYCLFSNHILEAIRQLSYDDVSLEADLWHVVELTCEEFLTRHPSPLAEQLLGGLLRGAPLPAKGNFFTRLTSGRDGASPFVAIGNPWLPEAQAQAQTEAARPAPEARAAN